MEAIDRDPSSLDHLEADDAAQWFRFTASKTPLVDALHETLSGETPRIERLLSKLLTDSINVYDAAELCDELKRALVAEALSQVRLELAEQVPA